ncbi:MAG TPA: hypothetical protein VL947_12820, partial [Cytophagales bacterium]|nr:hypothetical protein [Cytophagales bacterium]
FSIGLIFIGSTNLYFSVMRFQILGGLNFILILTIISIALFVWVGYRYMITDFVISMAIPLLLLVTGFILIQLKSLKHT